jgi:HPt (histidine-containing phosphotransfer) domain-containing protein
MMNHRRVAPPEPQLIDLAHLARYTGGVARLDAEVLELFSTQTAGMLERLEAALEPPDAKAWRDITHSLKGAANGIGAFALGDSAASAEAVDPSVERGRAAEALHAMKRCAGVVSSFIDTYLDR